MKKKNILILLGVVILVILIISSYFIFFKKDKEITDGEKFAKEYTKLSSDNVFTYRSLKEINKMLEKGTGVVYLGFPECPWCQGYVGYIDEIAKKVGIDKVYYSNVLEDRSNNTEEYQTTIKLLKDYLPNDEEGNPRVYVPLVVVIKNGKVVIADYETAKDTKGYKDPEEYWANEDLEGLKTRLEKAFNTVKSSVCTDCNK